jgi:transposase InsO family protein
MAEAQRRTVNRVPGHAGGSPRSLAGSEQRTRDRGERRSEAEQSNERWQADITHWRLAGGTDVEILNVLDDHSRSNLFPCRCA